MFKIESLKALFYKRKPLDIKVKTSSNFMAVIQQAKKNTGVSSSDPEREYSSNIHKGRESLQNFSRTKKADFLKKSAESFLLAVKIRPSKVEAHANLAYIFYLYKLNDVALNHLKIAEKINPAYPLLKEIRGVIFS